MKRPDGRFFVYVAASAGWLFWLPPGFYCPVWGLHPRAGSPSPASRFLGRVSFTELENPRNEPMQHPCCPASMPGPCGLLIILLGGPRGAITSPRKYLS